MKLSSPEEHPRKTRYAGTASRRCKSASVKAALKLNRSLTERLQHDNLGKQNRC